MQQNKSSKIIIRHQPQITTGVLRTKIPMSDAFIRENTVLGLLFLLNTCIALY